MLLHFLDMQHRDANKYVDFEDSNKCNVNTVLASGMQLLLD